MIVYSNVVKLCSEMQLFYSKVVELHRKYYWSNKVIENGPILNKELLRCVCKRSCHCSAQLNVYDVTGFQR